MSKDYEETTSTFELGDIVRISRYGHPGFFEISGIVGEEVRDRERTEKEFVKKEMIGRVGRIVQTNVRTRQVELLNLNNEKIPDCLSFYRGIASNKEVILVKDDEIEKVPELVSKMIESQRR